MLDFVTFIAANWDAPAATKQAMLDDFVEAYHWQENITDEDGNEIPNPVTKAQLTNYQITRFIVETVNAVRKRRAEQAAIYDDLDLE